MNYLVKSLFGAPVISFQEADQLSNYLPDIIVYAAPVIFFFVLLEWCIAKKQRMSIYQTAETIGSLGAGIGNALINTVLKLGVFSVLIWLYNLLPWRMHLRWWTFFPCYIVYDFCSYWTHRISHQQRFWWASHVVHHSAEHFNLSVSFRSSCVQQLKLIFFLPVVLLGFHPVIFFLVNQVAVLYQFWQHTEYIKKLHPIIEFILATSSHLRVHHGSQPKYINKSSTPTFILWDRLFGKFQPEEEQVQYGLTHNIGHKADPLYINFHEYTEMWKVVRCAKGWQKKWFYLFGNSIDIAKEKAAHASR